MGLFSVGIVEGIRVGKNFFWWLLNLEELIGIIERVIMLNKSFSVK